MHPDTLAFLEVLFQRCTPLRLSARLTFTVIHPNGNSPTPSRHIALKDRAALLDTLQRLADTNRMGWGAYFAVGLRKPGLSRWKRAARRRWSRCLPFTLTLTIQAPQHSSNCVALDCRRQ